MYKIIYEMKYIFTYYQNSVFVGPAPKIFVTTWYQEIQARNTAQV